MKRNKIKQILMDVKFKDMSFDKAVDEIEKVINRSEPLPTSNWYPLPELIYVVR